ncbi:MAG: 1-acyl-sn-glycerol-3-phosphate acyltransferase [Spirochaetes bacterium]|nr:1-acyl-sn-glycerol-3-phosphate acyltransferase [Spirochaetota bacterium]
MLDLFTLPKLYWKRFVLWSFQPFYIRYFKLKGVGLENCPKEGSYLIVANHSHLLDPFFIGALIRRPIFQMASNEFFRKPLVRRFMWAMGAFPRKKGFTDFKSIKHAIHIVREGHPLVIYPEGGRNWDGETLPILHSIAKLVKLLGIPLVTVVSKGNYLAYPRWADKRRKSPITIHYSKPVLFGRKSTDDEIIDHIRKGIYNNDNYTEIKKIRGKNPARGIWRLLWRCPSCRTKDALVERDGHTIYCSACKKEWEADLHCRLKEKPNGTWRALKEYSDAMFDEAEIIPIENSSGLTLELNEEIYLRSKRVTLLHEPEYPGLEVLGTGILFLTDRRLVFMDQKKHTTLSFRFDEIRGRSTERNNIFQLVLENDIARFIMDEESCYKWEVVYDHIRRKSGYQNEEY